MSTVKGSLVSLILQVAHMTLDPSNPEPEATKTLNPDGGTLGPTLD